MLSCKIFWTPYSNVDDVYRKLKEIEGEKYVYKRVPLLPQGIIELSAKFLRINKVAGIIIGTFAFEKTFRNFDLTRDTPIDSQYTVLPDFA